MDWHKLTFGNMVTPTHVFEIYHKLLKTHLNDANYHMLAKILKFSTTRMQYAHDD